MAFILANPSMLARDKWPGGIATMVKEREHNSATLPAAKPVPADADALCEWISVEYRPELSQALVYIRSDVQGIEALGVPSDGLELVIRLQGVVSEVNLAVGGDWDGTEVNAKKANQTLTLVSGGFPDAFEPQVRALASIRATVLAHLGRSDNAHAAGRSSVIVLKKRVFTKIRTGYNDDVPSVVKSAEDPRGKFRAISHSWRVTERLAAGTQLDSNDIVSMPALSLRKGDVVDVSMRVCVVVQRGSSGKRFQVSFEPTAVIRLANPQQFLRCKQGVNRGEDAEAVPVPAKFVARRAMPLGYSFAPEGTGGAPTAARPGAELASLPSDVMQQ